MRLQLSIQGSPLSRAGPGSGERIHSLGSFGSTSMSLKRHASFTALIFAAVLANSFGAVAQPTPIGSTAAEIAQMLKQRLPIKSSVGDERIDSNHSFWVGAPEK